MKTGCWRHNALKQATLHSAKPDFWTTPDLTDFKFSALRQINPGQWLCSAFVSNWYFSSVEYLSSSYLGLVFNTRLFMAMNSRAS